MYLVMNRVETTKKVVKSLGLSENDIKIIPGQLRPV